MKILTKDGGRQGLSLTEQLVLVALIALFCILAAALFGRQGRVTLARGSAALGGNTVTFPAATGAGQSPTDSGAAGGMGSFQPGGTGSAGAVPIAKVPPGAPKPEDGESFWEELAKSAVEGAEKNADKALEVAQESLIEAAGDLSRSERYLAGAAEKAATDFAKYGEEGSILSQQALQSARTTVVQDAATFEQAAEGFVSAEKLAEPLSVAGDLVKVVGVVEVVKEGVEALDDPANAFKHVGKGVGDAAGIAVSGAVITFVTGALTAVVGSPLLAVAGGILAAAVIGWGLIKLGGYLGSKIDAARRGR